LAKGDPELALISRLDPHALGQAHDRYYPVVFRYVRYRLGEIQASEDIAAEVFLRLLEAVRVGKGPTENLKGWLLGTAAHLVADNMRRRYANREEALDDDMPSSGEPPQDVLEGAWQENIIREILQKLTEEQQHVLALRFGNDLSLEETARVMNKSVGAVKVLQFRALASLKRAVGVRNLQ
jgi:RNA polymerase sigma-70 factor (ECF subfamily)